MSDQPENHMHGRDVPEPAAPGNESEVSPPPSAPRVGKPIESSSNLSELSAPRPASLTPTSKPEPIRLEGEDEVPLAMRPIKDLDVCPNCGAPMSDVGEVVCLRCGFDLKTMKQVKTATGVVEIAPGQKGEVADETQPVRKPISLPGRGGIQVPLIMAAVAGLILILGYLGGAHGLFWPINNANGDVVLNADITFGERMKGLLRFIVHDAMWTACGLGSLVFLCFLLSMRLGDLALAAARMLGIVTVAHLVTFINFSSNAVESIVELILGGGIFAGLSLLFFDIKPKDLPTLAGGAMILFLVFWLCALAITTAL